METSPRALAFEEAAPVALKEQVAARIAAHRSRRRQETAELPKLSLGMEMGADSKSARVAAAVAERYARSLSYREFLAAEAESAIEQAQQAEAAAEVAARSAQAVAVAQTQLLVELQQWTQENKQPIEIPVLDLEAQTVAEEIDAVEAGEPLTVEPTMAAAMEADDAKMVATLRSNRELASWDAAGWDAAAAVEVAEPVETPVPLPANLLEFPRVLVAPRKARPRLAEGPLREEADASPEQAQLRIFEVDAKAVSAQPVVESVTPVWSTIRLSAHVNEAAVETPSAQLSFVLPPQTALLRRRVLAGAVDAMIVMAAFAGFGGVFFEMTKVVPKGPVAIGGAAAVLFTLGLMYQLLCFTLGTSTTGMRVARIGLCTFGDENPTQKAMRMRVLAMLLSACPLGLGYLWAWLDDDRLGWHDRLSRMYQRSY